jgi:hypothetical protein
MTDLDLFIQFEAEDRGRRPRGFEVAFGGATEGEALGRRQPVTIDLGDGLCFKLRGRIDRITRWPMAATTPTTRPAARSGRAPRPRRRRTALQHALYARAAPSRCAPRTAPRA